MMIKESNIALLPIKIGSDYDIILTIREPFVMSGLTCKSSLIDKETLVVQCDFVTIVDIETRIIKLSLPRTITAQLLPKIYVGDILFIQNDKVRPYITFTAPVIKGLTRYE